MFDLFAEEVGAVGDTEVGALGAAKFREFCVFGKAIF